MHGRPFALRLATVGMLALAGCDGESAADDAGANAVDANHSSDASVAMRCGNSVVEGTEECDDGNRSPGDGCSPDCRWECGDGTVSDDELCDIGIAPGEPGACPTSCDDGDACTTDVLDGTACNAQCIHGAITAANDGDGCCPPGADANTDSDCASVCGNGIVEDGETCDTDIAAGEPGACPTRCDDGIACTTDTMIGEGCTAACVNEPITAPADGDGCCPTGATEEDDSDCAGCGDGVVVAPETCDIAIPSGAGSCPTSCDDGDLCTSDTLIAGGTCMATCAFTPITAPIAGDGCCPPGATIGTDSDCAPRCGDGVVTPPEECDDGNPDDGDGCSSTCTVETAPTVAFRFDDLDLRDPHVFAEVLGCVDATNRIFGFIDGVNPILQNNMENDSDGDGLLDLSIAQAFAPLVQAAGSSTPSYLVFPDCTASTPTSCTLPAGAMRIGASAMNIGGEMACLDIVPGTTRSSYTTPTQVINVPTAPAGGTCYVADGGTITFNLGPIPVTLTDAQLAGEWLGNPATGIRNGLLRGFLSEADANATIVPAGTTGQAAIDCLPLSSLLPGGNPPARTASDPAPPPGCADGVAPDTPADPPPNCAPHDDMDVGPTGERGWYFYLNFSASLVTYTEG